MYMYICICIYVYMYTYASTYICMHQSSRCTACSACLPEGGAPDINQSIARGWATLLTQINRGAPRIQRQCLLTCGLPPPLTSEEGKPQKAFRTFT